MKIVADDKIPFLRGVFESCGVETVYKKGAEICRNDLLDADALIVRTRTKCNAELLAGTSVKAVASATIGMDHMNIAELEKLGIAFFNAPGCNAMSVQQYVICALLYLGEKHNISLAGKTLGIIGVGHVGSAVADAALKMGMKVLLNDPPRAAVEGNEKFTELAELLEKSDFVTLHVPLDGTTKHLADEKFFKCMKSSAFFINSSRGEVCDNAVLKKVLQTRKIAGAVLDVWENEPYIDIELQQLLKIGTMHIAGYSADGKANGTTASVQNIAKVLGIKELQSFTVASLPPGNTEALLVSGNNLQQILTEAAKKSYDISIDSNALLANPQNFEKLRGDYYCRREFKGWTVNGKNLTSDAIKFLEKMNFKVIKEK
ncbi:MAG: 4-phosphoerythronate dehydrogenase [Lentisphaeria bacterium]|nr:4-phosphoerythronate dehydrogenase [Lentisphaeria bacterium]